MTRKGFWLVAATAALCFVLGTCIAGNTRETRKTLESSMLVTGTITIRPDGTVQEHALDPKIELPDELRTFIANAAARWRFEPVKVDGRAVTAKAPMSLRLVAKQTEDGGYAIRITGTEFANDKDAPSGTMVEIKHRVPMSYPVSALRMGGKGTVYLLVRVARDGRAMDVEAEQVNLRVVGNSKQMQFLRDELARSAIQGVKRWTFTPPTSGPEAAAPHWIGRIAVNYVMGRESHAEVGEWDTYVPGPRNTRIPWAEERLRTAGSPDAVPEGGFRALGSGPRLLTPEAS